MCSSDLFPSHDNTVMLWSFGLYILMSGLAQLIYLPPFIYLFIGLRFGTLPLFALWSAPLSASTVLLQADTCWWAIMKIIKVL